MAKQADDRSRPDRADDDVRLAARIATVFSVSWGLLLTVHWLNKTDSALELLSRFPFGVTTAFLGIGPAIAFLLFLERHLPAARARRRIALVGSVLLAGTLGSWLMVGAQMALTDLDSLPEAIDAFVIVTNQLAWLTLVALWREALRERRKMLAALHESELRDVAIRTQASEAELQLLQAQIEPHFLVNSLANVRRLGRLDAVAGKAILADLLHYLQQTLPGLRETDSTLAREAEAARAYLAVHKVRMGDRLEVEFAIPAELGATPLPPLMLLTLIENALKHGVAPLAEGGAIRVAAERVEGSVRLSVADTGRGIVPGRGTGTGLANLRTRLRTLHGSNASLGLHVNQPRGVVASIVVPCA